jgi:hypothetical protein
MGEKLVSLTAVNMKKAHPRRLRGFFLWLARSIYFVTLALIIIFFAVGFPAYLDTWNTGAVGALVTESADGRVVFTKINPSGDAAGAGIRVGDELQAINGIPVTSAVAANQAFTGEVGVTVTMTVQTGNATAREIPLVYAGPFLKLLESMHLSHTFLVIYYLLFSCLLGLCVILCSPLVFFRRSDDWLVILVAFAMITFASLLLAPVGYGAQKLHVAFMTSVFYLVGMVAMIIVFFLFPSGHFEPRWTSWASILIVIPAIFDLINLNIPKILTVTNYLVDFFLWVGFFALGAFAQVYRYRRVATPSERQQTKMVVFGGVVCFGMIALLDLASILISSRLSPVQYVLYNLFVQAATTLPVLVLDLSFVLAIYHYRLWDTDLYINRTVVYSLVTFSLMAIWILTTQGLNYVSQQFFGKQINWLGALLSSLQVAVIYKPVRKWVEKWANTRFYKDRIDYNEALVELRPEMWDFLTPADLGHTLVTIVPTLTQSASGALFLCERRGLILTEVHNIHPSDASKFQFTEEILKKLENANVFSLPECEPFKLLVPLTVSRLKVFDLVGVLAIGPRTKGRDYSRDHLADLSALGRSAGMALHMLKLKEKKQGQGLPGNAEA